MACFDFTTEQDRPPEVRRKRHTPFFNTPSNSASRKGIRSAPTDFLFQTDELFIEAPSSLRREDNASIWLVGTILHSAGPDHQEVSDWKFRRLDTDALLEAENALRSTLALDIRQPLTVQPAALKQKTSLDGFVFVDFFVQLLPIVLTCVTIWSFFGVVSTFSEKNYFDAFFFCSASLFSVLLLLQSLMIKSRFNRKRKSNGHY